MAIETIAAQPNQLAADANYRQLREQGRMVDAAATAGEGASSELRDAFDAFVGQTFYGMLMKSMRESLTKTPYFHGGRGEEVFQQQLDQVLVERMAEASAETFTEPMFELFTMRRG